MKTASKEVQVIRQRREELGYTQEQVALECGLQLRHYQRFEYGESSLSRSTMRIGLRLCAFLELDPYEMVPLEEI